MNAILQQSAPNTPRTVLIAARSHQCENYIHMVQQAGLSYRTLDFALAAHIRYAGLLDCSFDLLLLPGGGDFETRLYATAPFHGANANCCASPPDYPLDQLQFLCLQCALLRQIPVLGICKGMQLINVYFGGDLYPHLATSAAHCYKNSDQLHRVTTIAKPQFMQTLMYREDARCALKKGYDLLAPITTVNSAHHQGIHHLGAHLHALQYAPDGVVEALFHDSLPVLGLQWHPERLSLLTQEARRALLLFLLDFPAASAAP